MNTTYITLKRTWSITGKERLYDKNNFFWHKIKAFKNIILHNIIIINVFTA